MFHHPLPSSRVGAGVVPSISRQLGKVSVEINALALTCRILKLRIDFGIQRAHLKRDVVVAMRRCILSRVRNVF